MTQPPPASSQPSENLVSPENLLNPIPLYHRLQANEPVHFSPTVQAWFLTRHEDVARAFRDPRLSAERTELFVAHQLGNDVELARDYVRVARSMMLLNDGAKHARMRKQANQSFTNAVVEGWRPAVQRVMDGLLDAVEKQGRLDLVRDVAGPLPSLIMAELLGIPAEDRSRFQEWSDLLAHFFGGALVGDIKETARKANDAVIELQAYLRDIVDAHRKAPGQDLVSSLLRYEEEGRMDTAELLANLQLILVAGHVTTIDQLSNAVHALLGHPEQLALLRRRPELLKSAVEEVLRFSPAVPFMHRISTEAVEVGGKTIPKGQVVFLGMAAANRDPAVFSQPDTFDITRENNKHLSFAFGPHLCLGAGLARRELEVGLETLFRRLPKLGFDASEAPRPKVESLVFRGFHSLPLTF